jgi:hypothetical protein
MQFLCFWGLSMTLSCSHYCTVNVPYVLLPKCKPQLNVSLPLKDDPKFLACCILSENRHNSILESLHIFHWRWIIDFKWLYKQKSSEFKSVEHGGHAVGPPLTIHIPGNFRFRYLRATRLKCARAPSCIKCSSQQMISGMLTKKSGMFVFQELCNSALCRLDV